MGKYSYGWKSYSDTSLIRPPLDQEKLVDWRGGQNRQVHSNTGRTIGFRMAGLDSVADLLRPGFGRFQSTFSACPNYL